MVSKTEQYMSVLMWIVNQVITFQMQQHMYDFCGAEEPIFIFILFFFWGGGGWGHGSTYFNPVMKQSLKVSM